MVRIPLAKTDIGIYEVAAVSRVMESGRLAFGPELEQFERDFAEYHGVPGAVMINSGTSALMISLLALGVGEGDEVIMPALTFVGTVNAILATGATPVLVDVRDETANIDITSLKHAISEKTKAFIPVHLYGLPARMKDILEVAEGGRFKVIEDACEAIGAIEGGLKVGAIGDAGVFGFYPNKVLTTGEGGMIISNDETFLSVCRSAINQGRSNQDLISFPSYSLRGSELGAAIGRVQLASLEQRALERQKIAEVYLKAVSTIPRLGVFETNTSRSWFTFPVILPKGIDRGEVMLKLTEMGIESANYFPAIHTQRRYRNCVKVSGSLHVSENLAKRVLCLPFWPGVEDHVSEILDSVSLFL